MSKATRIRQQNAREKIAAQRAAARRAEVRKRTLIVTGSIVAVLAIVVAFVAIGLNHNNKSSGSSGSTSTTGTVLPASVHQDITTVPASALDKVGVGSVPSFMAADEGGQPPIQAISDKPLTSNGKPEMLYIGAEFCPYCAAMRWSMAVALSRFGTFTTPLRGIHSSSTDTDPNTPTLTFYKSSYSSKYLTFTPVENETVDRAPLQPTTAQQQAIWDKYDANSYPFIYFGGKYMITTPIYDPQVLQGKTWAQIAAALHDPSSAIAQGALGAANYMTAAICKMTGNQPASVCSNLPVSTP